MDFVLAQAMEILARTPAILNGWLRDLPDEWVHYKSAPDRWSAFDIVGHFVHGEKTDWIPRAKLILQREGIQEFEPFDRFAQFEVSKNRSIQELLDEFQELRQQNIELLRGFNLQPEDYSLQGMHPDLGIVNLRELLSTWVVHDLDHISQLITEMAKRYEVEVGPWRAYLGILNRD